MLTSDPSPQPGPASVSRRHRATDSSTRPPRRVLILCGDADGNLGDRAIVQAMCHALRQAAPHLDLHLTVPSASAERAAGAYNAATLPTGPRALPALLRAARGSDLVICGGGGLFQDDDSLIKMPYWAMRLALVRHLGRARRIAGVSLGIGPLHAATSRHFARRALTRLDPLSARDPLACELARSITGRHVELAPDPALLLEPAPPHHAAALLRNAGVPLDGRPLIGVAPRRFFPPAPRIVPHRLACRVPGRAARQHRANHKLATLLAATLDRLLDHTAGHVLFLPTYNRPYEADDALCRHIAAAMRHRAHHLIRIDAPALYKAVAGRLNVMLGGRMHPLILAAGAGTPIVALAYNPKFQGLCDMLNLPHQLLDVVTFVNQSRTAELETRLTNALHGQARPPTRVAELADLTRSFLKQLAATIP